MSTTKQEQENLQVKIKKPSLKRANDEVYKVNLSETKNEQEKSEEPKQEVVAEKTEETPVEEVKTENEKINPIQEIKKEEKLEEIVKDTPKVETITIPDNLTKVVDFMKETGGTLDDYVRLNADYSKVDGDTLLREYYKHKKPHLNYDEIDFLMQDKFSYDEEVDEERDIKKKKLAIKEEVAEAKKFLSGLKDKYYEEIKLRSSLSNKQKEALNFYDQQQKEQEEAKLRHEKFKDQTNNYLNTEFEGFEYNVGDKSFRYNVNNPSNVANQQSNIKTFLKKFLNNSGEVEDYKGYHKALYTASNADQIAEHFYEQGKADAVKDVMAKSKNISNEPRTQENGDIYINGLKVKALNGVDSSKLKIKYKK